MIPLTAEKGKNIKGCQFDILSGGTTKMPF